MSLNTKPKIIVCTGPTASGKTALVHSLANTQDIIINADSRQLYQHLDIATAKPSLEEQATHPYKLLDHQSLSESFTAHDFLETVRQTVATNSQGSQKTQNSKEADSLKRIFIVGGTLFYLSLLETGLPTLKVPKSLQDTLEKEYQQYGLSKLLAELEQKDPEHYQKIDRQNPRRVLRALAVIRHTQKPFSHFKPSSPSPYTLLKIILIPQKKLLWKAIETRAENMFEENRLIDEVKSILSQGISKATLLRHKTIGYLEAVEYLNGFYSKEIALEKTIKRTKKLVKHQINWLKKQQHANFIFLGDETDFNFAKSTPTNSPKSSTHSLTEAWTLTSDNIKNSSNNLFFAPQSQDIHKIADKLCHDFYRVES